MKKRPKISTKVVDDPHVQKIRFPTDFIVDNNHSVDLSYTALIHCQLQITDN